MENANEKTPTKTRRSNSTIKQRIECLMSWRDQQKIVCKEPKKDEEKKASLMYETNLITKQYKKQNAK